MLLNTAHAFERPKLGEARYVGEVEDNNDPELMGRCKIRIVDVFGSKLPTKALPWAAPADDVGEGGSDQLSSFSVPVVGTHVLVYFHKQDIYSPIYEARLRAKNQLIEELAENYPNRYGFKDSIGNVWYVDKTPDADSVVFKHHTGTQILIDTEGTVTVDVVKDSNVNVAENNTVVVDKNCDVTIKENSTVLVEGDAELSVDGNMTTAVGGALTATVDGAADITVGGRCDLTTGSLDATVNGQADVSVSAQATITVAAACTLKASGILKLQTTSQLEILSNALCKVQASQVAVKANRIELGEGSLEPMVLGNKLSQFMMSELIPWLMSHSHTGNLGSPTSPPMTPFVSGSIVPGGSVFSKKNTSQ